MTDNPLAGYFRQPAIHLPLPSNGDFYPPGSIEMPETRELKVYPMTTIDEVTYKTPDALFNGSAVTDVIKSCLPEIKDPWSIPAIDINAILIAIRIASFGHNMEINTICPKCSEPATYELDLRLILDSIETPDFSKPLDIGDLRIFLKPLNYKQVNENSQLNFEQQQLNRTLANDKIKDDEKIKMMSDSLKKISNLSRITLSKNIAQIVTPESTVDNQEFILDFLSNCEREIYKAIRTEVIAQRAGSELKPIHIKCDNKECGHEYEQPFIMDMSTFFE